MIGLAICKGLHRIPTITKPIASANITVHSGPRNRHEFDVEVTPRDFMVNPYLSAFLSNLFKEADVQEVMCATTAMKGKPFVAVISY